MDFPELLGHSKTSCFLYGNGTNSVPSHTHTHTHTPTHTHTTHTHTQHHNTHTTHTHTHTHTHTSHPPSGLPWTLGALAFFSQGRPIIINFGKSSNEIRWQPWRSASQCMPEHLHCVFPIGNKENIALYQKRSLSLRKDRLKYWAPCGSSPQESERHCLCMH